MNENEPLTYITIYDRIPDIDNDGLLQLVRNWTRAVEMQDGDSGHYGRLLYRAILELERRGVLPSPAPPSSIRKHSAAR